MDLWSQSQIRCAWRTSSATPRTCARAVGHPTAPAPHPARCIGHGVGNTVRCARFRSGGPRRPWDVDVVDFKERKGASRLSLAAIAVRVPQMMTGSVLDILIYVFDRYM